MVNDPDAVNAAAAADSNTEGASPFDLLEARLAGLKAKMIRGLPERVRELEGALAQLRGGEPSARDVLKRYAHKLRGVVGTYGFDDLTQLAAQGESAAREGSDEALKTAIEALILGIHQAIPKDAVAASSALAEPSPPIATAKPAPEPTREAAPKPVGPLEGLRVLAADDDDATRRLLEITLRQVAKCEAHLFDRGHGLLAALESQAEVDLVIVDAMMPEMNGLEFLQGVAARGLGQKARLFVVLSAATAEELGWQLPTGLALGWLRKPFRPRELVASLEGLILQHPR